MMKAPSDEQSRVVATVLTQHVPSERTGLRRCTRLALVALIAALAMMSLCALAHSSQGGRDMGQWRLLEGTSDGGEGNANSNVCTGHRCDTGACPCGCECGTGADPGVCFDPNSPTQAEQPHDQSSQMNADVKYTVSNPDPHGQGLKRPFRGDFFEVDSPKFKSRYSQVIWTGLPDVPLPEDIVRRFDGKVIGVTGWEVDVMRDTPSGPQSVPCYESYNHHYVTYLSGKGADVELHQPDPSVPIHGLYGMSHGGPEYTFHDNGRSDGTGFPTSQAFSEHNGNEARQTYHGLPRGYAVPVESPTKFSFSPMQINTRNPDGSGRRCGPECPLPRHHNNAPGAPWNGILECPCGSRMIKTFDHRLFDGNTTCTYSSTVTGRQECFAAAASLSSTPITRNLTTSDPASPPGCSVRTHSSEAVFNTAIPSAAARSCHSGHGGFCVCRGPNGWINGKRFEPNCMDEPLSDLIKTHNPACDINLYDGGLGCCGGTDLINGTHMQTRFLLEADQAIPPLVDEVYFRWRFYYEDWATSQDKETYHLEWQFGHIEYSVPKAPAGTPPSKAVHTLTTRFQMKHLLSPQCNGSPKCDAWRENPHKRSIELIMLGFHCHAPACLGGELRNRDTGELLCRVEPLVGRSDAAKDETGYLWLPPCQWGRAEDGLLPPPVLPWNANFTAVKRVNNTVAHYGVMAIWQGRGAYADDE